MEISWEIHANMYGEIIKNSYEILMNLSSTRGETDDEFNMKLLWILHMNCSHEFHVKFVMKSSYKFSHEIHEIFSHEFHENFDGGFIWISYQIHELCLLGWSWLFLFVFHFEVSEHLDMIQASISLKHHAEIEWEINFFLIILKAQIIQFSNSLIIGAQFIEYIEKQYMNAYILMFIHCSSLWFS